VNCWRLYVLAAVFHIVRLLLIQQPDNTRGIYHSSIRRHAHIPFTRSIDLHSR
jgi:hypothetical protein